MFNVLIVKYTWGKNQWWTLLHWFWKVLLPFSRIRKGFIKALVGKTVYENSRKGIRRFFFFGFIRSRSHIFENERWSMWYLDDLFCFFIKRCFVEWMLLLPSVHTSQFIYLSIKNVAIIRKIVWFLWRRNGTFFQLKIYLKFDYIFACSLEEWLITYVVLVKKNFEAHKLRRLFLNERPCTTANRYE